MSIQWIKHFFDSVNTGRKFLCRFIATVFFMGNVPCMPGTVASLVTAITVFFIHPLCSSVGYILYFFVIVFLFVVGVLSSACLERLDRKIDPSYVVIDEVVGMLITLWGVPHTVWWYAGAFVLFRFFDISKIFPICVIERCVYGGWGMMLDDMVAGLFSLGILQFLMLVFPC